MTWSTVNGDRILYEEEGNLFAACIETMIEVGAIEGELDGNEPDIVGPFADLSPARKYTVLESVTEALLEETEETPELTEINEGAIRYVFEWLKSRIESDLERDTVWGPMIWDALDELIVQEQEGNDWSGKEDESDNEDHQYPCMVHVDMSVWENAIDRICNKIVWDTKSNTEMFRLTRYDLPPNDQYGEHPSMDEDSDYFKPYRGRAKKGAKARLLEWVNYYTGNSS